MPPTGKSIDHAVRLERALLSLDGLSVGDAVGERFFLPIPIAESLVAQRAVPREPWGYTDDTEMALSIVQVLDEHGRIEQDALARLFGTRYRANPYRGYGGTAHEILQAIHEGEPWRKSSSQAFGGSGSMGNGGAMRAAPIGAWFADDLERVVAEARASAERHGRCRSRPRPREPPRSWAAVSVSSPRTRCPTAYGARPATWTTTRRRSGAPCPVMGTAIPPAPSWAASSR